MAQKERTKEDELEFRFSPEFSGVLKKGQRAMTLELYRKLKQELIQYFFELAQKEKIPITQEMMAETERDIHERIEKLFD